MQIILCDDEKVFAGALAKEVKAFFDKKEIETELSWYGSGEELLAALNEKAAPDLLFMDIDLGTTDGVTVVREIRKLKPHLPVIFLSAMEERVLDGYDVKAFSFLYKRDYRNRLSELLERFLKEYVYACRILVKEKDAVRILLHGELYWVEAEERGTKIHTKTESVSSTEPIHSFAKQLAEEVFVEVYHCLYVNVDHISRVDSDSLLLDNGAYVPVSRRKRKSVVAAVMKRLVTG